jgi:hypothetical protein
MREYVIYRLEGQSYECAARIASILQQSLKSCPLVANDVEEFKSLKTLFNRKAFETIENSSPEIIEQAGLRHGSTQIYTYELGEPRAYINYPVIYAHPDNKDDVYMVCPLDYKGEHFIPDGGVKLDENQTRKIAGHLFKGGWLENPPFLEKTEHGTELPENYDPLTDISFINGEDNTGLENIKIYRAQGRSLEVVKDFVKRQQNFNDSLQTLMQLAKATCEVGYNEMYQGRQAKGFELNLSIARDQDNYPHLFISMLDHEEDENGQKQHISPADNQVFLVRENTDQGFRVEPNKETELGRQMQKLLDGIRTQPQLGDYWQLFNPTAPEASEQEIQQGFNPKVPHLGFLDGDFYLSYVIDTRAEKDASCPPDAVHVPLAEFLWRVNDAQDRSLGIEPPPMPKKLTPPAP